MIEQEVKSMIEQEVKGMMGQEVVDRGMMGNVDVGDSENLMLDEWISCGAIVGGQVFISRGVAVGQIVQTKARLIGN